METLLPTPAVIAHRGASAYAPENTLPAFELAVNQNADAVELDAKLTLDEQVIIVHDQTVDRTTNGHGRVNQMTCKEIQSLDAGSWFGQEFINVNIPTLAETFTALKRKIVINIELTNYGSPFDLLPEKTAALVKEYDFEDRVFFSSFNPIALIKIHQLLPQSAKGLLALPGIAGIWTRTFLAKYVPHQAYISHRNSVTSKLISNSRRNGKYIHAYTVNLAEEIERLFSWGINGIITDDPPLALQLRDKALK